MNTQCISDLQRFEIFRNSSFFSTFWLIRNFYSCDAHHANYGKHSLNNHFQQCPTLCIWDLQCFKTFRNFCLFCTFWLLRNFYCGDAHHANYGKQVLLIISNIAHTVYIRFKAFWNFSKLQVFLHIWLLRNFYSGDAHHANYGKHSLNHHFQHWTHSVYQIYSVLKFFEIPVSFPPFGFYKISTVVMRIMLTMANKVLIIISNIAHTVYIRFKAFWNFSKLQFVLHLLAFTKFLLGWCASC